MIEIKVQQEAFAAALNVVTKASNKSNGPLPAFGLVRLEVSSKNMQLTCFNGEFAARGLIPAQCLDSDSANVNAATLREIVQTMTGEITIKVSDDEVRLEAGPDRAYLRSSTEVLPAVDALKFEASISLKGTEFRKLAGVSVFASLDGVRAALQGVHLTITGDESGGLVLQAQAADGFCLGRIRVNAGLGPGSAIGAAGPPRLIPGLPAAFLRTLAAVVETDDEVLLQFPDKGNQARFEIRGEGRHFLFVTALLQDEFPAAAVEELVNKALPAPGAELVVQNSQLERVIRQVNAMGTKCMFVKVRSGLIRVASNESEFGQARNILPGEVAGGDAKVWVNTDLLLKLTKACATEMSIKIGGPTDPVLIKSADLIALVMPLHDTTDPFEGEDDMPVELTLDQAMPASA